MNQTNASAHAASAHAGPPITQYTISGGAPKLAKWCRAWEKKCRAAGLVGTMISRAVGRPSMGRTAYHLQLRLPGKPPATFSFKGATLDAIDDAALRNGTLALMKACGLGRERETGEKTPAGVPLMRFVPAFGVQPAMRVSVGRACAHALAAYLGRVLTGGIVVTSRWPDPDKRLPARAVSIIPVGHRRRDDASTIWQAARSNVGPDETEIAWEFGGVVQPLQLDIWDRSEDGRDDTIAQLDDVLYAGLADTLQDPNSTQTLISDPVRDGVLVPMFGRFAGGVCDCWFDDPAIDDTPDAIQRGEYRATYTGDARTAFTVTRTAPRLLRAEIKIQTTLEPPGDIPTTVIPFATVTLTPDDSTTPPSVTVTHGTSTT